MSEGKTPATIPILQTPGSNGGHAEKPPALLWAQRNPVAHGERNALSFNMLHRPGEHAQLLAQKPIHRVVAHLPRTRLQAVSGEACVERTLDFGTDRAPARPVELHAFDYSRFGTGSLQAKVLADHYPPSGGLRDQHIEMMRI